MRRLLVPLAVLVAGFGAAPAQACSVPLGPERFEAANRIVVGTVSSVRVRRAAPDAKVDADTFVATVRVSRVYKGLRSPTVRVRGIDIGDGACGAAPPTVGARIALYLDGKVSPFKIGSPSLTTVADLDRYSGGRYRRPVA